MHVESSGLKAFDDSDYTGDGDNYAENDLTVKSLLEIQRKNGKPTASITK